MADWEAIKDVFAAAAAMPASARDAYVEAACGERPDVARAVRDLLAAHDDASSGFLEPGSLALRAAWLFRTGDLVAGRFRITRPIARGAMGEVYEVFDERLRLAVALKAIRPELLSESGTVDRFRREVLVTRDIAHEGLCRVFDLVEHPLPASSGLPAGSTLPCLTMQLLQGESLESWLSTRRPLPLPQALAFVRQIAGALQTLHDAGIVHRDLKPSNVVIVDGPAGPRAVLTDFGLARPLEAGVFETQGSMHAGAPYFMAPEVFRGARPSRASDIYALGLLIDELVTERRAFSATSLHALVLQKMGDGPERPGLRAPGLPARWEAVIRQCVDPNPLRRIPSARDVVARLDGRDRRAGRRYALEHPSPRWRHLAGYSAVGLVVLGGTASLSETAWTAQPPAVAMAAFVNDTGRPELNYLATGITGELSRRLSRLPDLQVQTVPDDAQLKNTSRRPRFTLGGVVEARPGGLALVARIVESGSGRPLWSESFEGPEGRALVLEQQLAAATVKALDRLRTPADARNWAWIVRALRWRTTPASATVPASGTSNAAAFDAYLRGRVLFEERTLASARQAIAFLQQAVALDPAFAAPHAALADVHGVLMDLRAAPHGTLIAEAERHALRAIELEPTLGEAYLSLAAVRQMQWNWAGAEEAYRTALELHPSSARAHRWYGGLLLQFGRADEALARYRHALELDPFDYPSQSALGHALFNAGRPHEAATHLERLLAQKDLFYAHALLGQVYAYLGRAEPRRAREFLSKALAQAALLREQAGPPGATEYADLVAALAWSYQRDRDAARPYVDRLEATRARGGAPAAMLARVFAAQGDAPRAIAQLLEAEAQRDRELLYVNVSPVYAGLRADPAFRALVKRLHLAD